jgi:hypothetical protein
LGRVIEEAVEVIEEGFPFPGPGKGTGVGVS